MTTERWLRRTKLAGATWELELFRGRLDAWRDGLRVRTIDEDGKDCFTKWFTNRDSWPMEIAHAWNDMLDVMKKEAVQ